MKKIKLSLVSISLIASLLIPSSAFATSWATGATIFNQLIDNVEQLAQDAIQGNTYLKSVEEYVRNYSTEPLIRALMAQIILRLQNDTLTWIRSGFHGAGPAFIVNPDAYFKNVANEAIAPQLQAIQNDVGNIFANSVIGQTILGVRGLRSLTSSQLKYTLGNSIQASLCNQQNLKQMAIQDIDAGLYVGPKTNNRDQQIAYKQNELWKQLCLHQAEGNRILQQNLTSCFAKNFSCGGWDAWLGLTNPNNTAYGQAARASILINQKAQQAVKQTADQFVNGLMPKTKCVEYAITNDDEGNPIPESQRVCTRTEVVTPAASVANALFTAQKSGTDQVANNSGMGLSRVILSAITTGMLQRLQEGISSGGGGGINVANPSTITLDANGKIITTYATPVPVNSGNGGNTTISGTENGASAFLQQFNANIATLGRINGTLTASQALFTAYETDLAALKECYSKISEGSEGASSIKSGGQSYIDSSLAKEKPYADKVTADIAALALMNATLNNYKKSVMADPGLDNVTEVMQGYITAISSPSFFNEAKEARVRAEYDQYKKQSDDDRAANLNPKLQECRQYLPPD